MRELRVEDALMYLDQVKMEFGDQPQIYNKFLDIMKTFKSQQIDTPGVIRQVSSLFQGNKRLVLGFNTFLPEGYKIELPIDGGGPVAVYRAPGQDAITQILGPLTGPGSINEPTQPHHHQVASGGPPKLNQTHVMSQQSQPQRPGPPPVKGRPMIHSMHQQIPPQHPHPRSNVQHPPHQHQKVPQKGPLQHTNQGPHARHQQNHHLVHQNPAPAGSHFQHSHNQQAGPSLSQQHHSSQNNQRQQTQNNSGMVVEQPSNSTSGSYQRHHLQHLQQQQQLQPTHLTQQNPHSTPQQVIAANENNRNRPANDQLNRGGPRNEQKSAMRMQRHPSQTGNGLVPGQQQIPTQVQHGLPGDTAPNGPHAGRIIGPPSHHHTQPQPQPPQPQPQPPQPPSQQPVEFDHAINYVTTIKKRFASEPDTYKSFLEILHTYQKEQRGIKEVLDEVSTLFADHPDLLREFTYFLPDAVQAQAKAQLAEIVEEAEKQKLAKMRNLNRNRVFQQNPMQTQKAPTNAQYAGGTSPARTIANVTGQVVQVPAPPPPIPFGATQGRSEEREKELCRGAINGLVSFKAVRPPRKSDLSVAETAQKFGRPVSIPEPNQEPNVAEEAFFERAKKFLIRVEQETSKPGGTRRHTPHAELLKCLHLFAAGILNKEDLLRLTKDILLLGKISKSSTNAIGSSNTAHLLSIGQGLVNEFESILLGRGPFAEQEKRHIEKSKYGTAIIRDIDFSRCKHVSPSYFKLPSDYPLHELHIHSGQTPEDASVLNSSYISVGPYLHSAAKQRLIYSPEAYNGPRVRRNDCEDMIFKVEDDMFEMDMAVERNSSTIRQLHPLFDEITALKEGEEKDGQPIGRMQYKFRSSGNTRDKSIGNVHVGAIARVYGDSGDEVIHHLVRNPIAVLPIVFKRLQQKDQEWRKVKSSLVEEWRLIIQDNYEGSLDVCCHFFRREIERSYASDQFIEECKRSKHFFKHPRKQHTHPATQSTAPTFHITHSNPKYLLFQPHVTIRIRNSMPHKDAFNFISIVMTNKYLAKTNADREKACRIWSEFIVPLFDLPVYWFLAELRERTRIDKSSSIVKYAPGQKVRTAFGDGNILDMKGNQSSSFRYTIEYEFGIGHIRPSSIVHALPSNDSTQFARRNGYMEFVEKIPESPIGEKAETLDKNDHILFGTEKMYIFLRIYCLLVSILSELKDSMSEKKEVGPDSVMSSSTTMSGMLPETTKKCTSSRFKKKLKLSECSGYGGVLSTLKECLSGDMDLKTYETICRFLSKELVYKLAALPRLIEKCSDALMKVAKEDLCLSLFDFSQLKHMDPVRLHSQVREVTVDATYRIQYHPENNEMIFGHVNSDDIVIVSPETGSSQAMLIAKNNGETQRNEHDVGMSIEGASGDESLDDGTNPHVKRQKLK